MENKIAVIYKSKYGATKRYAGWIALKLDADLYEVSDIGKKDLKAYDTIIYGGPLYIGKIKGIKFITNNYEYIKEKNVCVFMVGMREFNDDYINFVLENNLSKEITDNIKIFYFRGKMNYQELSIKDKILMTGLRVSISNKKQSDISDDEKMILEVINKPIDYIDKKSIDILLNNVSSNYEEL
ncbi:flavodoxin domain-containing protein [Romboutsia ilealis]|uniref:flavodoxin domain-containing protein n=1 Tax=Romboutsia ilealis TaxID=1115758 RepID=UPI0025B79766|nr:flavodoxin domain-containing protein [Romboutsia ilealis]